MFKRNKMIRTILTAWMAFSVLAQGLPAFAASDYLMGEVNLSVTPAQVKKPVEIKGGNQTVDLHFRDIAVSDALRALGRKGGFNVAINDSVQGRISVDLKGVTIQEALEAIKTQSDLNFSTRGGDTLMVSMANSSSGQELRRTHSDVIPLKHANASVLAQILNQSVFAPSSLGQVAGNTGGGVFLTITPDFRSNSLIVVGTPDDVQTVHQYVDVLDTPRESKTWRLSHADAVDMASLLTSSLFNEGFPTLQFQGAGGGGGGGVAGGGGTSGGVGGAQQTVGVLPSTLRVRTEDIEEGEGGETTSNTGGGEGSEGAASDVTLRSQNKTEELVQVTPNGIIIIPDTRLNTITLFGTAYQLEVADRMIANLDRRAPQVVIETALVEVDENAAREHSFNYAIDGLHFGAATNNNNQGNFGGPIPFVPNPTGIQSTVGDLFQNIFRYTSNFTGTGTANEFFYQINFLINNQQAKVIANPTVVTVSDKEAVVSIVDEIISRITTTIDSNGGGAVGQETEIGEVGVTLNILPKVAPNGDINMRIRPTLSTIADVQQDIAGNQITLLNRREALAQNIIMRDGQTFVMGGLIVNEDNNTMNKMPFIGDLPIIGALARASVRAKNKRELLIIITPHIINDDYGRVADYSKVPAKKQTRLAKGPSKSQPQPVMQAVSAKKTSVINIHSALKPTQDKPVLKLASRKLNLRAPKKKTPPNGEPPEPSEISAKTGSKKEQEAFLVQAMTVDGTRDYMPAVRATTPILKIPAPDVVRKGGPAVMKRVQPSPGNTKFIPPVKQTNPVAPKSKASLRPPKVKPPTDIKPPSVPSVMPQKPPPTRRVTPDIPVVAPKVRGTDAVKPRLAPATVPKVRTVTKTLKPLPKRQTTDRPLDTSDQAINAIIRKFLPEFDPKKDLY